MKTPKYFTLEELMKSSTALNKKIANLPSWQVIENLNNIAVNLLDPLREAWGSGIGVSSGFRNLQLNAAVKGVAGSEHTYGCACDIYPVNGKFNEFVEFLKKWLPKFEGGWDKTIIETSKSTGGRWVHIVWKSHKGEQRRKLFNMLAD